MSALLSVQSGPLAMEVDSTLSGRVTQLLFRGKNLLSTRDRHADNWGATYWTSPQSQWGWPPITAVDGQPYEQLECVHGLKLRGPLCSLGERRLKIEKHFEPGVPPGTIDAHYSILNVGETEFHMANWEISRVTPGGLTFFPTGEAELNPVAPHHVMPVEKSGGTTFYDHAKFDPGKCMKLHADGRGGYLAHVAGELLLLKIFSDTLPEQQAPGEGECEIFAMDGGQYVEVEVQGAYAAIAPGQRLTTTIRTAVCPLPTGLSREDRTGLRKFADQRVAALI